MTNADKARALFPCGLTQPEGSFRFSVDALLLAAFVVRRCLPERAFPARMLDLGCGCGVVGFACLLERPELVVAGIDVAPELAAAATANAAALGLGDRFAASLADLAAPDAPQVGSFPVVAANPPFYRIGSGRLPFSPLRRKALFADEGTLPAFARYARNALAPLGVFALIYPWGDREYLFSCLESFGFGVRTVVPVVAGTRDGEPSRCLVSASLGDEIDARVEPPLVLRGERGGCAEGALRFCPWLTRKQDGTK